MGSWFGFGNEPAWIPGYLSRFEERACWLHKVWCLDSQVQSLEAASFFGRAAKQHDGALPQLQSCAQTPLLAAGRADPADGAVSSPPEARGEQEAAALTVAEQDATTGARTRGEPALLIPEAEPRLEKSGNHEHQRTQLPRETALLAPRADTEPLLLQKSPRPRPAVQHGTLRQPDEADTAPLRRSPRVKPAVQLGTLRQPKETEPGLATKEGKK